MGRRELYFTYNIFTSCMQTILSELFFKSSYNAMLATKSQLKNLQNHHLKNPAAVFRMKRKRQNKFTKEAARVEIPLLHNKIRPAAQEIFATAFKRYACVCTHAHVENKTGEVENFRQHLNYVGSQSWYHLYYIRSFFFFIMTAIKTFGGDNACYFFIYFFFFFFFIAL